LRARILLAVDAPSKSFGVGVGPVLQKRSAHVKPTWPIALIHSGIARPGLGLNRGTQDLPSSRAPYNVSAAEIKRKNLPLTLRAAFPIVARLSPSRRIRRDAARGF
jgi:hypothetical protein